MAKIKKKILRKKEVQVKPLRKEKSSKVARILVYIAATFLVLNGIISVLARNWFVRMMQQYGFTITAASLVTYGIIWLVLAFLFWATVKKIEETGLKSEKWLLLALSVITFFAGRWEAAILALIASIIYLRQK